MGAAAGLEPARCEPVHRSSRRLRPTPGLTEAVHTQTEGNPLFVTEVVRLLVQEGELTQESGARDSWTVRIPEGVREVIGRRLNRLSQRCNETLTIGSVIGREFELRQLRPWLRMPRRNACSMFWRKPCQPGSSRNYPRRWAATSSPTP